VPAPESADGSDDLASALADLHAEQESLRTVVAGLATDDWFRPTPARGWDVRDTIAHLADTDEIAVDTCTNGPRPLNRLAETMASAEDVTLAGVLRGRRLPGTAVAAWWDEASARERDVLAALDPLTRVPWGLGMRARSFVTARLMETWAHGLDVHAALGRSPVDTDRLCHVAWLGYRSLPYAFSVAGREPPPGALRVELAGPDGDTWAFGAPGAPHRVTGSAGDWCRRCVQRQDPRAPTSLKAQGDGAEAALEVARAFL